MPLDQHHGGVVVAAGTVGEVTRGFEQLLQRLCHRFVATLLQRAGDPVRAEEPVRPSALDKLDRDKIPARLKPPKDAPRETLVELGLRDGRWDTIAAQAEEVYYSVA